MKRRAGDVIVLEHQTCRVLRVTECAALVAMPEPTRMFTTRGGAVVSIHPADKIVRISPNSEVEIMSRRKHKPFRAPKVGGTAKKRAGATGAQNRGLSASGAQVP